jgi:hypothetical protein
MELPAKAIMARAVIRAIRIPLLSPPENGQPDTIF